MMRENFDLKLVELKKALIDMGAAIENALTDAITAFNTGDRELADSVIANDEKINEMEDKIQNECVRIITTQQPIASDLRLVTSCLKMVTDLERIGDQAADISDITKIIGGKGINIEMLNEMADIAIGMVKGSIDAYVAADSSLAEEVAARDDKVDELFDKVVSGYETFMQSHLDMIDMCVKQIIIAKYIERIGDHATNIAEWVIYSITGRHRKLN